MSKNQVTENKSQAEETEPLNPALDPQDAERLGLDPNHPLIGQAADTMSAEEMTVIIRNLEHRLDYMEIWIKRAFVHLAQTTHRELIYIMPPEKNE